LLTFDGEAGATLSVFGERKHLEVLHGLDHLLRQQLHRVQDKFALGKTRSALVFFPFYCTLFLKDKTKPLKRMKDLGNTNYTT
jgi:hypothetical protein